jgi:hypothetical protein
MRAVPQALGHLLSLRHRGAAEGRNAKPAALRALPQPRPGLLATRASCRQTWQLSTAECTRCCLDRRLRQAFTPAGGTAAPELDRLREALVRVDRPDLMLDWLKGPGVRRTLQDVAARGAVTHEAIDALPQGRTLVHVRSMLVAAGALPARDERLTALERWISQVIAAQADPGDRQALRVYALWHHLRRLRGRLDGRPVILPAPLDALVTGLAAGRRPPGSSLLGVPSSWLFPGRWPGRALTEDALAQRLHAIGISPRQGRSTALFTLAAEVPAAILAKTLGIHVQAAIQWQKISAGDWTAYGADVSRRTAPRPVPS